MKTVHLPTIAAAAIFALISPGNVRAVDAEKIIPMSRLPEAAAHAIEKHAGGAKISKVSKETDDGKIAYEATTSLHGRTREISVDAEGRLLSDEQTIGLAAAPKAVRSAIEKKGGKVEKLECVKEDGKTQYEALISSEGKRQEVIFSEAGKVVKIEDKKGREKD